MFDDLDDLLEDNPKPAPKKTTAAAPRTQSRPLPSSMKQDDIDDLDFFESKPSASKKPNDRVSGSNQKFNASTGSFGMPKKEEKKDEWEGWGFDDKPQQKSYQKEEARSSTGSYTGFGVLGKSKPAERPGTSSTFKNKKDDDDIDSILDGLAKEKKVELEKPREKRPVTSDARQGGGLGTGQKSRFKSQMDPWERDNLDELEDNEDAKSKVSAGRSGAGGASRAMQEKRNALFGLQGSGIPADQPQNRGNTTSKSQGKLDKDAPLFNSYNLGGNDPNMGTIGNMSQSQDSGIETIEVANSRSRQMRKIPQRATSGQENPKSSSLGRPPTGNAAPQQPLAQFQYSQDASRVQTSPIGYMQQNQPQQNFQIAPLQRPQTGIVSGFGKPPRSGGEEDESHVLDLLGEQKDRSYKGSVGSGGGPGFYASLEHDEGQFERFDEGGDDMQNSPQDSDNSDLGGGYLPTAIQKAAPEQYKNKPASKKPQNQGASSFHNSGVGMDLAMSDKDNRGKTISSDLDGKLKSDQNQQLFSKQSSMKQQQQYQGQQIILGNAMNSIGSQGTIQTSPILIQNSSVPIQSPILQQPPDEKTLLLKQIEEERARIKQAEDRHRKQLDEMREDHKRMMKNLEEKQGSKLSVYNEEKKKLIEDMNKTIELEKQKLTNLHKIDVENREMQYKKNLDGQKSLYEDQNESLKKQLQQQVQMNSFGQEIQKSSGNINQLVTKLSAEQEGEIKRREDELSRREKEYQDKKKHLYERKQQMELRKKKLEMETDEVQHKLSESRLDFEREKQELLNDTDKLEQENHTTVRDLRNKNIELEVDIRRTKAEREKITSQIESEDRDAEEQLEILIQQKKQIVIEKENFRQEMTQQEGELKHKLREIKEKEKDQEDDERLFQEKVKQFDHETKKVQEDHEKLQDQLDKYCMDREVFDREAQRIKEQGERDQLDSEKVGYFKANKDRLKDELRQLREDLENERDAMREDRIKLDMYKNELKTRQKTIESMRYEYIKSGPDSQHKFLDDAKDLGYYNIQRQQDKNSTFFPINPPKFDQKPDPIAQNRTYQEQRNTSSLQYSNKQQRYQAPPTYQPRFKYDEYMRNLKDKLQTSAPITSKMSSDFQLYVLKERENYLKGLNDFDLDQPLVQSISHYKSYHRQGEEGNEASPFNIGSLRDSQYQKKGLGNSQFGKNSTTSLQFMSKNMSNTPVEEVDRYQGKISQLM